MRRFIKVFHFFCAIIIPVFLIMTSVMILFNPWFLALEYSRPGFPADPYGFTKSDRLQYAGVSLEYMHNTKGIEFLAEPRMADGTPLYNERELSHMADVKHVFQSMVLVWFIFFGFITITGFLAWRYQLSPSYWQSLSSGGWASILIVAGILVAVVLAFNDLFTIFHQLFFSGDSWLFEYSDSLIRLFPLPFWMDAFIWMGAITVFLALILALGGRWLAKQH